MEKRRYPRKPVNLDVECEMDDESAKIAVKAIDISCGGIGLNQRCLGFDMGRPIQKDSVVNLTINGPFRKASMIKGKGRIVWTNRLPTGDNRMGVEFTAIAWTALSEFFNKL